MEVVREESYSQNLVLASPHTSFRESLSPEFDVPSSGAASGLPPIVSGDGSITPNIVYTIPPPLSSVFYLRDVIERAKRLELHPSQEHMRYAVAQSLTHN